METEKYRYRILKLDDMESNKKYKFYKTDNTNFTAIFDSIINNTLLVRNYETEIEKDNSLIRTMPKEWIIYVESEEHKIMINNFFN
jgi:hypothetical protein